MSKLDLSFYRQTDTLHLARQIIGKKLCTNIDGLFTSGIICEVEAYLGAEDKASHAYGNKRTNRTEVMFAEGGVAYVYLCYGILYLFNIVCHQKDVPHAILIRNIIPEEGIDIMRKRRNHKKGKLTTGPGTITKALGITLHQNYNSLFGEEIWLENGIEIPSSSIKTTARIGVDYAGKDAKLPYRFLFK